MRDLGQLELEYRTEPVPGEDELLLLVDEHDDDDLPTDYEGRVAGGVGHQLHSSWPPAQGSTYGAWRYAKAYVHDEDSPHEYFTTFYSPTPGRPGSEMPIMLALHAAAAREPPDGPQLLTRWIAALHFIEEYQRTACHALTPQQRTALETSRALGPSTLAAVRAASIGLLDGGRSTMDAHAAHPTRCTGDPNGSWVDCRHFCQPGPVEDWNHQLLVLMEAAPPPGPPGTPPAL